MMCWTTLASSALRGRHGDAPFSQRMTGAFLDLLELFVEAGGQSGVAEADRGRAIADFVDAVHPRGGAAAERSARTAGHSGRSVLVVPDVVVGNPHAIGAQQAQPTNPREAALAQTPERQREWLNVCDAVVGRT